MISMELFAAGLVVLALFIARASKQATTTLLASILYFLLTPLTAQSAAVFVAVLLFVVATKLLGWH